MPVKEDLPSHCFEIAHSWERLELFNATGKDHSVSLFWISAFGTIQEHEFTVQLGLTVICLCGDRKYRKRGVGRLILGRKYGHGRHLLQVWPSSPLKGTFYLQMKDNLSLGTASMAAISNAYDGVLSPRAAFDLGLPLAVTDRFLYIAHALSAPISGGEVLLRPILRHYTYWSCLGCFGLRSYSLTNWDSRSSTHWVPPEAVIVESPDPARAMGSRPVTED